MDAEDLNADESIYNEDLAREMFGVDSLETLAQEQLDQLYDENHRRTFGTDPREREEGKEGKGDNEEKDDAKDLGRECSRFNVACPPGG